MSHFDLLDMKMLPDPNDPEKLMQVPLVPACYSTIVANPDYIERQNLINNYNNDEPLSSA